MKLFGRKSAGRASVRPALARACGWGEGNMPHSYEGRVRAAIYENPVAQRAVRLISEGVGHAPLACSDPALRKLVRATTAGQSLLETVAAQILLHGNGFIQILERADGTPADLFALRPERMTVERNARGWPIAFSYMLDGVSVRMAGDRVIHVKSFNPLDDHYGLGCLGAATGAVAIHDAATRWNKALLDNAARPSGAMVYDPGEPGAVLSAEQFERLRDQMEESFAGARNAGRPMLLEGGLKWQSLGLTPAEMDFAGLKAAAARDIALGFGVPPVLLGLPGDAKYANYREANRALWRQTILPLAGKLLSAIGQGLAPWFPDAELAVDLDHVAELAEDRERFWLQLNNAGFLTQDEKRAMIGLEPLPGGAGAVTGPLPQGAKAPVVVVPVAGPDADGAVAAMADGAPPLEAALADPSLADDGGDPWPLQLKFNPNHDPANGQFTDGLAAGGGASGRAGLMVSGSALAVSSVAMAERPAASQLPLEGISVDLNSGAQTRPDGSVEVQLPPSVYYALQTGISVPKSIQPQVDAIGKDFFEKTGKILTINSGYRDPQRQADAMYVKFRAGKTGAEYANKRAVAAIYRAYVDGRSAKETALAVRARMKNAIDSQTKKGTYISLHMTGRAVDIKTSGMGYSARERVMLGEIAAAHGGRHFFESTPPHLHIQFPSVPPKKHVSKK
jgi:HK97 family phage portal protein